MGVDALLFGSGNAAGSGPIKRMNNPDIFRRLVAELLGTLLLLTTVVGSGIMAERLAVGTWLWPSWRTLSQLGQLWSA